MRNQCSTVSGHVGTLETRSAKFTEMSCVIAAEKGARHGTVTCIELSCSPYDSPISTHMYPWHPPTMLGLLDSVRSYLCGEGCCLSEYVMRSATYQSTSNSPMNFREVRVPVVPCPRMSKVDDPVSALRSVTLRRGCHVHANQRCPITHGALLVLTTASFFYKRDSSVPHHRRVQTCIVLKGRNCDVVCELVACVHGAGLCAGKDEYRDGSHYQRHFCVTK